MPHVESLCVYPVKGCRPVNVQSAFFERTGLAFDRQWMFVRQSKAGRFISQRQHPKIALIQTTISADVLVAPSSAVTDGAKLTLTAPDMPPLEVPLVASGKVIPAAVWEFSGTAYDQGDEAADWITKYLGERHRLVRYAGYSTDGEIGMDTNRRPTDPQWTQNQEVAFADGYPALIVTQATLDELNKRLEERSQQPLPLNRFRGNIVVAGCHAAEEDEWEELAIGHNVQVLSVKPCDRCKVTCTDQATGEVGNEPLITLREFRSSAALGWDMPKSAVFFGWNLVPQTYGVINVGDVINCTKWRTERVVMPGKKLKAIATKAKAGTVTKGEDVGGAVKAALTGATMAAAVASLLATFFYLLLKSQGLYNVTVISNPT